MPLFRHLRDLHWKEQNQIARELLRESEDIDGVQSVSSLAGYEILMEGTGSNSGTCLINLKSWEERKESAAEIIEKLEEKAKNIPVPILNSSSRHPFRDMEQQEVSNFVYWIKRKWRLS